MLAMNLISETGKASAEPLHWVIDRHAQNCILLKRGRNSIVAVDFDGKNYTVMLDPKKRSSMGCQRATFKDANDMVQRFLNSTIEGGTVPECPSNIRRWLRHGQDVNADDGIRESEENDQWEKATSSVPKDFFEWKKGKHEGEAFLMRGRKQYIKICKRLPAEQNSDFYKKWIKDKPYSMEWCAYAREHGRHHLFWEYPDLKSALKDAERHKKMDYSANALVFPDMPKDVREWLRKGRRNPNAEAGVVNESENGHSLRWEVYKKRANRASLVLDGKVEVASVSRNEGKTADILPYVVEVYTFTHACEFSDTVKSIADAQKAILSRLSSPSAKHPAIGDKPKVPMMPTSIRLWIDKPFDESVISEKV